MARGAVAAVGGLVILSASLALMIAISPFQALGPAIAEDHYGSAAVFGVLARVGAGTIVGSLALRWRPRPVCSAMTCAPWSLLLAVRARPAARRAGAVVRSGRRRHLAVPGLVGDRARRARPAPGALARAPFDWMGSLGLVPLGYLLAGPTARLGAQRCCVGGALGWRSRSACGRATRLASRRGGRTITATAGGRGA